MKVLLEVKEQTGHIPPLNYTILKKFVKECWEITNVKKVPSHKKPINMNNNCILSSIVCLSKLPDSPRDIVKTNYYKQYPYMINLKRCLCMN